jgi:hypothetical protein
MPCYLYAVCTAILQLPSDIERIALTTIHEEGEGLSKTDSTSDAIQLQLLVTRKVPLIGKQLLALDALVLSDVASEQLT